MTEKEGSNTFLDQLLPNDHPLELQRLDDYSTKSQTLMNNIVLTKKLTYMK